jgi:hypothetical protein
MTTALIVYSMVFMRYSMAVTPKNYLLFGAFLPCTHTTHTPASTTDDGVEKRKIGG